jgi:purine-binding chemotaxis protein CheW
VATSGIPSGPRSSGGAGAGSGPVGRRWKGSAARETGAEGYASTLCGFWLGNQCFAVSAAIVGEVVTCDALTPVPLAPAAIRGLFNLRGTPVAVIDLGVALALADVPPAEEPRPDRPLTALVLRSGELLVAVIIRRMEMVVPAGRGRFRPRGEGGEENPLVAGFLEIAERAALVMTVLGSEELMAKLSELRFRRGDDE